MILRMFSEEKNLSRERLCEKTGLSDATAKREIAFLKKTGYLERVGSFKSGYWKVYQNNCILGQMFNGWKITLNIWTHYFPRPRRSRYFAGRIIAADTAMHLRHQ